LSEWFGVLLALISSCLGGTAAAVTRYLVGNADPITLAILRMGNWLSLPAAGGPRAAGAMAAAR
jgi:drug/metabolite transporter (DMT)-like permease